MTLFVKESMRTKLFLILLCVCLDCSLIVAQTPRSLTVAAGYNESNDVNQANAAIITCTGMIDDGLYSSIKRRANTALNMGANYIILEIETYGGLVKSADDISKFLILDLSKKTRTVAYINTEAISAGAMISVSCQDIIMRHNTTVGDCAPIQMGGEPLADVEREKTESFIRATFRRAAQANNYPEALLEAMVSRHIKVWRVKNLEKDSYEFFEDDKLPKDANYYDLSNKELIDSENEILTLTSRKAYEYGIAREVVNDINEAISFLAVRDNVKFASPIRLEPNWSEQLVRMLNNPTVSGILFMIAMLAVYIELKTPGVMLPGLVAVICFAIIFGSRYLTGLATWWEIAVFATGIILLALELFVIPGFGIAGVLGILFILVSLFAVLVPNRPDELPWPRYDLNDSQWHILSSGAWGFILGFGGFVVLAYILSKFLPKTKGPLSGLILEPAMAGPKIVIDATAPPEKTNELKIGDKGVAITILRPAGKARFGDAIADVVAEGDYIKKDCNVKIVLIQGNRVGVRQID